MIGILCFRSGVISWSLPMRYIAASTTSSTVSPTTCATPCPMPPLSDSPTRRLNSRMLIRGRYSATRSVSTTSSARSGIRRRCRSTTESKQAKLALDESDRPNIHPCFEEAPEGEEIERKEKLKTRWAQIEAIVCAWSRPRKLSHLKS